MRIFITVLLFCFTLPSIAFSSETITIAIERNALERIQALSEILNVPIDKLEQIPDVKINRTTADVIILLRSLRMGGISSPIEYIEVPNARRSTAEVARGRAVLCSQQLNEDTIAVPGYKDAFLVSAPITRYGEFQKGFYTLLENTELLTARSATEINQRGKGIIGQHWNNDKQVLQNMGITNVIDAPTFDCMVKMLNAGRADWIPLEIATTQDFSKVLNGIRLIPIPGIKFSLLESRHFFVSRKHPRGKEIYGALQKGIKELRKRGFIHKILTQAGVFNPRTDSWTILNAEEMKKGK
ncbi:hypothetical protein [Maridesulfovibrio sp.]|uniref:hypothetical protein n=1 Tax=Maridesulfovibrio sp. TaxID=2795000 RepID=UPI003BACC367